MEIEDLKNALKDKHIIFDTNVLICLLENFAQSKDFLFFLKDIGCVITYFPLIEFEFTRGAFQKEHQQKRKEFLDKLAIQDLHFRGDEITEETIKIAQLCSSKNKNPDLVDCFIAAYLKKYEGKIFLATLNHEHFPQFLFERMHIWTIINEDRDKPIVYPIGIYEYSSKKEQENFK